MVVVFGGGVLSVVVVLGGEGSCGEVSDTSDGLFGHSIFGAELTNTAAADSPDGVKTVFCWSPVARCSW